MRSRDVKRLWAQIVHQEGIDKYTSNEWQKYYADFWESMQSSTRPFIRVESVHRTRTFKRNAVSSSDSNEDLVPLANLQESTKTFPKTANLDKNLNGTRDNISKKHGSAGQTSNIAKSANCESKIKKNRPETFTHKLEVNRNIDSILVKTSQEIDHNQKQKQEPLKTIKKEDDNKSNKKQIRLPRLRCEINLQDPHLRKTVRKRSNQDRKTLGQQERKQLHKDERNPNKKIKRHSQLPIMNPTAINLKMDATVKAADAKKLNNEDNLIQCEVKGKNKLTKKDVPIVNPTAINLKKNADMKAADAEIVATCKAVIAIALSKEASNNVDNSFVSEVRQPKEKNELTNVHDTNNQYFSDSSTSTELFNGLNTLVTDDRSDNEFDDMPFHGLATVNFVPAELNAQEIVNNNNNTTNVSTGAETINQCFVEDTLNYINSNIRDAKNNLKCFDASPITMYKTPLELDAMAHDVLDFDDDDVISVATSWNGDEETIFDDDENMESQENKQLDMLPHTTKKDRQENIACAAVSKLQLSNLNSFRIPNFANRTSATQSVSALKKTPIEESLISNVVENQQHGQQLVNNLHSYEQQPHVMKALYEQQQTSVETNQQKIDTEQNKKDNKEHVFNNRLHTRCEKANTDPLPVFAPPYRLPVDPLVSNSIVENTRGVGKAAIFGIKCWRYINGDCNKSVCCHILNSIGEVQRLLYNMKKVEICDTYRFMLRHKFLCRTYLLSFAEIFGKRGMPTYLIKTVEDCGLYLEYSAELVFDIFNVLLSFEMRSEIAAGHFMAYLWKPEEAQKYPQLTLQLLKILSRADWYNYVPTLEQLFYNYHFPMPVKFLDCILNNAIATQQQHLIDRAVKFVLYYPLAGTDDITVMLKILKRWKESSLVPIN